jgi:hypothetical protein
MNLANAKNVVLSQQSEWTRVMSEENDKSSLIRYGMTLIVITYAIMLVLSLVFNSGMGVFVSFSMTYVITMIVIQFVLAIASLYFIPMILAAIAPSFGGKNDALNALKLYVFVETPAWIGMAISRLPVIGWLVAIAAAIYAIYLFWLHVSEAMTVPEDKKIGYVIVSVIVLAVIYFVIGAIGAGIAAMVSPVSVFHGIHY